MAAGISGRGLFGSTLGGNMVRASAAELVGTFILVLAGASVAASAGLSRPIAGMAPGTLAVALAFALALMCLVGAIGQVSGAHVNPAVTLGLAVTGKFPWSYVPAYLFSQLVGGIVAGLVIWGELGDAARSKAALGATYPAATASIPQAFLAEAVITFVLVFVVIAVATDERIPTAVAAPAAGGALGIAVLIGGPVSGGAANPARALGPMIVACNFTAFWVYILAPIIGGIIAAVLYDRFIKRAAKPQ